MPDLYLQHWQSNRSLKVRMFVMTERLNYYLVCFSGIWVYHVTAIVRHVQGKVYDPARHSSNLIIIGFHPRYRWAGEVYQVSLSRRIFEPDSCAIVQSMKYYIEPLLSSAVHSRVLRPILFVTVGNMALFWTLVLQHGGRLSPGLWILFLGRLLLALCVSNRLTAILHAHMMFCVVADRMQLPKLSATYKYSLRVIDHQHLTRFGCPCGPHIT
jgi:hypothetical protein